MVTRDASHLEPAVILGWHTFDEWGGDQYYREMGVEIGRWGDATARSNAQYSIQPFYISGNVAGLDGCRPGYRRHLALFLAALLETLHLGEQYQEIRCASRRAVPAPIHVLELARPSHFSNEVFVDRHAGVRAQFNKLALHPRGLSLPEREDHSMKPTIRVPILQCQDVNFLGGEEAQGASASVGHGELG